MSLSKKGICVAVTLLLGGFAVPASAASQANEDSARRIHSPLVGEWEIKVPNAAGSSVLVLEFRPDGTYTLYAPINSHAGTYSVPAPGLWSLHATSTPFNDHGTFHLVGPNALYFQGQYGAGIWNRISRSPYFGNAMISGQRVPAGLRLLVTNAILNARRDWHPDAVPVSLRIMPQLPGHKTVYFKVTVRLYSPSTGAGRDVTFSRYTQSSRDFHAENVERNPITTNFIDLPKAIAIARRDGMRGLLKDAQIHSWGKFGSVWWVDGFRSKHQLAASTGKIIHGDVTGYIAQYNAQWDKAISGLQKLIKKVNGHGSGRGVRCSGLAIGEGIPCDPFFSARVSNLGPGNCAIAGGWYDTNWSRCE